eukprot:1136316-Pelagomonas_calceolata.AAC.3
MDIGKDDRLAQHNLKIPAHASNMLEFYIELSPPYLFPRSFPKGSRLTSSRPDAILVTPYHAKPTSPFSSSSSCTHHVSCSRHSTPVTSNRGHC